MLQQEISRKLKSNIQTLKVLKRAAENMGSCRDPTCVQSHKTDRFLTSGLKVFENINPMIFLTRQENLQKKKKNLQAYLLQKLLLC